MLLENRVSIKNVNKLVDFFYLLRTDKNILKNSTEETKNMGKNIIKLYEDCLKIPLEKKKELEYTKECFKEILKIIDVINKKIENIEHNSNNEITQKDLLKIKILIELFDWEFEIDNARDLRKILLYLENYQNSFYRYKRDTENWLRTINLEIDRKFNRVSQKINLRFKESFLSLLQYFYNECFLKDIHNAEKRGQLFFNYNIFQAIKKDIVNYGCVYYGGIDIRLLANSLKKI